MRQVAFAPVIGLGIRDKENRISNEGDSVRSQRDWMMPIGDPGVSR